MTTDHLYEFVTLSKVLNYKQAAEHLYISQSVLTKHIQALEQEFGAPLFVRNTHGVALTPSGMFLAQNVLPLLDDCNNALNALQIQDLPVNDTLRIGCSIELSYANHIRSFTREFMDRYPDISIDFKVLYNGTYTENMEELDLMFTPCDLRLTGPDLESRLVHTYGTYVLVYPGHHLINKSLLSLKDLEGDTLIVPFADELFGPYAQNLLLVQKYTHNNVNYISVDNLSTAIFYVNLHKGICLIPRHVRNLLPPNMFTIGISNAACCFPEHIIIRHRKKGSAAELYFEEFCQKYCRN